MPERFHRFRQRPPPLIQRFLNPGTTRRRDLKVDKRHGAATSPNNGDVDVKSKDNGPESDAEIQNVSKAVRKMAEVGAAKAANTRKVSHAHFASPAAVFGPLPMPPATTLFGVVMDQSDVELENLAPTAQIRALDVEDGRVRPRRKHRTCQRRRTKRKRRLSVNATQIWKAQETRTTQIIDSSILICSILVCLYFRKSEGRSGFDGPNGTSAVCDHPNSAMSSGRKTGGQHNSENVRIMRRKSWGSSTDAHVLTSTGSINAAKYLHSPKIQWKERMIGPPHARCSGNRSSCCVGTRRSPK
jgi:hypothetical protein